MATRGPTLPRSDPIWKSPAASKNGRSRAKNATGPLLRNDSPMKSPAARNAPQFRPSRSSPRNRNQMAPIMKAWQ